MGKSTHEGDFAADSTANAQRVLHVDSAGAANSFENPLYVNTVTHSWVYDSGLREFVGWGGSGVVDLHEWDHWVAVCWITAYNSGGGKTLNTAFDYRPYLPDYGATIFFPATQISTAINSISVGNNARALVWTSGNTASTTNIITGAIVGIGGMAWPYVEFLVENNGSTDSITGRVVVFGRN